MNEIQKELAKLKDVEGSMQKQHKIDLVKELFKISGECNIINQKLSLLKPSEPLVVDQTRIPTEVLERVKKLDEQSKQLETLMHNIETQYQAVTTEIESVEKIIDEDHCY